MFFLGAGYLYHKYESALFFVRVALSLALLALLVLLIKWGEMENPDIKLVIYPIIINSYAAFVFDFLVCTLFAVELFKLLPHCRPLEWVGQHSLVYYFICGGVPLTVSRLVNAAGFSFEENNLTLVPVILIVCAVSTAIVYLIYKYVPFVAGKF